MTLAVAGCGLDTAGGVVTGGDAGASSDVGHTLDAQAPLRSDARVVDALASSSDTQSSVADAHDGGTRDAPVDGGRDHTEMAMKDASDGPAACSSTTCGGSCPPCAIGGACTNAADCSSSYCDGNQCAYAASCNALLQGDSTLPSGAYTISAGGSDFAVYCDMVDEGGGWTLIAKMGSNATSGTFDYNASYWTTDDVLNTSSTDTTQTEAKLQSFNVLAFSNVLAEMTPIGGGAVNSLVVPLADTTSFLHMMNDTNPPTTNLGRAAWVALPVPAASIQSNCNAEGVNQGPTGNGAQGNTAHVRLGLLGNDGNDCVSPDSYVGFGGEYGASCAGGASYSAGSMGGGVICSGGGNVADFGYLFVR